MPHLEFIRQSSALGYALLFGPGIVLLLIALAVKGAVKTTHNFVISGRLLGFGFGVASLISVWTWSMAVMLSSAQAYTWGTSGLVWFIVPNGLAVIIMVPFALKLRQKMPAGYTLAEFIRARFQNSISSVATLVFLIGALLGVIMINLAGLVLVMNKIFGLTPISIVVTGIVVVTVVLLLRRADDIRGNGNAEHPAARRRVVGGRAVRLGQGRRRRTGLQRGSGAR